MLTASRIVAYVLRYVHLAERILKTGVGGRGKKNIKQIHLNPCLPTGRLESLNPIKEDFHEKTQSNIPALRKER